MRTSDIAYVKQGDTHISPVRPIESLDLRELVRNYLCYKAQGKVSVCCTCQTPCAYGKRAVELTVGPIGGEEGPVPYEGSILQKARAELYQRKVEEDKRKNAAQEEKEEHMEEQAKEPKEEKQKVKKKNMDPEGWYEEAMASPDPTQWTMNKFGKSRTQAKKKIYMYRYTHPEVKKPNDGMTPLGLSAQRTEQLKQEPVEENKVTSELNENEGAYLTKVLESRIEYLMNQQEEYEAKIKEYSEKLEKVKEKIDVLCKSMDILKE